MNVKKIIKRLVYSNVIFENMFVSIRRFSHRGGVKIKSDGFGRVQIDCIGKHNSVFIGDSTEIHRPLVYIKGNNNRLEFGKNCIVGPGCSFRLEGNNVYIKVGDKTTFTRNVQLCAQEDDSKIIIGNDVMFSNSIIIRTSDSHPIYSSGERINPAANIVIGNHVWIAPNSKVFKGVTIGDGAIVGSDTLVTRDVSAATLVVGHPAKAVKEDIMWTREDLY